MTFKPRSLVNPMKREKNPVQKIDRWNPPIKDEPISVPRATIEPNQISTPDDPLRRITRKPRG
jgi:hypothetical protein